ncbi:hypothetical protein JW758_02255 [Candidatus Peregrinibacteria bacterium]|nr:hypothetical protein [Candidatus Peregrinibacteria bacterium]
MSQTLLFLGFTALIAGILICMDWFKKISFKSSAGLFLSGILISIPFILIEYLGVHLKFYLVILAFIAIELAIIYSEKHVKSFHDLLHHNIKNLRIFSFILIGIGFTYSELSFFILHSHAEIGEIISQLPLKTAYAMLIHTVLASAASLANIGNMFAETIIESILKFLSYYIRIAIISVSHYLYVFSVESHISYLIIPPLLIGGIVAFFHFKKLLDNKLVTA